MKIVVAALLLGVLGCALMSRAVLGINVLVWTSSLVATMWALESEQHRKLLRGTRRWLLLCALLFAGGLSWRDAAVLKWLDVAMLLLLLLLTMWETEAKSVRVMGVLDYVRGSLLAAGHTVGGFLPLVLRDVRWQELPKRKSWSRNLAAVGRGLVIAIPLMLVFGGLLAAADEVFSRLVSTAFNFDANNILSHALLTICFMWLSGGYLRGMCVRGSIASQSANTIGNSSFVVLEAPTSSVQPNAERGKEDKATTPRIRQADTNDGVPNRTAFSIGVVETSIVLGSLNLLFFIFVCVQVRYFFGGDSTVQLSPDMTYAVYARRGFFELVWVVGLVLPLLLVADRLLDKNHKLTNHMFRVFAGVLLALVFVIMCSAVGRMRLYVAEYGLTELRFYTTAFMAWLGLTLLWFAIAVLVQSRRERFAFGSLAAACLVVVALHVINPDDLIVRTNLQRAELKGSFDLSYAASLSADAVPALVAGLPTLRHSQERTVLANNLLTAWSLTDEVDWRSWSLARCRAGQAVKLNEQMLRH